MWCQKTHPLGFTAYYYLKNDFLGQKCLEFVLAHGMQVNLCCSKPGRPSVLPKAILGQVRRPPTTRCWYHSPSHNNQNVSKETKITSSWKHCANLPELIEQDLQSLYLRCYKVWNKWDFTILETDSLNPVLRTDCHGSVEPMLKQRTIWCIPLGRSNLSRLAKVKKYSNCTSSYILGKLSNICTRAHVQGHPLQNWFVIRENWKCVIHHQ